MKTRKFLNIIVMLAILSSTFMGSIKQAAAMPASPVDETKVPHDYGPFPNWANSPMTSPDANVAIVGDGTGATATAIVGGNGAITGFTITNPGHGYTAASVNITGAGTGASANATVSTTGSVIAVTVGNGGTGYTAPSVVFSGGGPVGTPATVTPIASTRWAVNIGSATGGTFALTVDALTTGPIAFNALAADVQLALTNAGISTVSVTGTGTAIDPWVITFTTAPATVTINQTLLFKGVIDASATVGGTSDVYNVSVGSATGGTFALTVDALTTGPIAFNALAADVQLALTNAGISTVSVTGTGTAIDPWVITFTVAPLAVSINPAGLTQGVADAGVVLLAADSYLVSVGSALGGTFILTVDGVPTAAIAWNALPADVQLALTTAGISTVSVTGAAPAWTVVFTVAPTTVAIDGTLLVMPSAIGATATAYGKVEQVVLDNPGANYQFPTVDFDMPNDPNGIQATGHVVCVEANCQPIPPATTVTITGVAVDNAGSGYSAAPGITIRDGTIFDPINGGTGAQAHTTLIITAVGLDTFGSGYVSAPAVQINDPTGLNASATATVDVGAVTAINLVAGGSGYVTPGGIKKFQDGLPGLCDPTAGWGNCVDNNLGQHIPLGVADKTTFTVANGFAADADYYVIALVQHRERMSSSLPAGGSLLREYVQLETPVNAAYSKHVALTNELADGTIMPALMPDGTQAYGVDDPHYLGPIIVANKDRAVRIVFYNLLPTGTGGNLFLPVDTTIMGSGTGPMAMPAPVDQGTVMDEIRNPICTDNPQAKDAMGMDLCFTQNRSTIHLHGGRTPWISDGTAHQWITPAGESTQWPQGVAVGTVPDMARPDLGVPDCSGPTDGCSTFYYTNQQSARLLFYHDHLWGATRLNVYAGVAAGYLITDSTEQALISSGKIPAVQIPLVIQDKTFVPGPTQMAAQDPTWDYARWGGEGNLWYHHVYMAAQNPADPSGMSAYGRWFYGPYFWPPATPVHGPITNPYYNMDPKGPDGIRGTTDDFTTPLAVPCNLDDPATWQYDTDPFCEPQSVPGTPNISVGMEQFNDTPLVNGTAYPTVTLDPKSYRFRILNAANDRFWNLQWYIADPTTGTDSEVALDPALVAAAQLDPTVFPTALQSMMFNGQPYNLAGPDWIAIGSEGGFLPKPVVIDGQQVTTWITDPTRFDFGNVDLKSLALAPAERADVIVDFSQFAGKTLILYNDAPAAYPARIPSYDYYTGYPDMWPNGPSAILPGYGPNTRTIMQVKINNIAPAPAFNLTALNNAFSHKANGTGVFESGQDPIVVGQAAYNSAYGTNFAASAWCNGPVPTNRCDGFARINDQGGMVFGFNTLLSQNIRVTIPIQPKAIHDEMNAVAFDEYGRMTANMGLEAVPATPAAQNIVLYPFVNPATELYDGTLLPPADVKVTPISNMADGTQIWKITHNGVDTHPLHWHLYDVQVLNRVTWDNIIIPPDGYELGWKDTVKISPLQDTYVALRPTIPVVPFELPNSIRPLNPMMPLGDTSMFNSIDPNGNPARQIVNQLVNFGYEYTWHCHILSHEEMDMMRPASLAMPPRAPDGLAWSVVGNGANRHVVLAWNDNSINETSFTIQTFSVGLNAWVDLGTVDSPLDQPNTHGPRSFDVPGRYDPNAINLYRVIAKNTVGYGQEFPSMTVQSAPTAQVIVGLPPAAPTTLTAALQAGPTVLLAWRDNATNESGFAIERSTDGVNFTQIATAPARANTGTVTYVDNTVTPSGTTYTYRVKAVNLAGSSAYTNNAAVLVPLMPATPSNVTVANVPVGGGTRTVILNWTVNPANITNFIVERATNAAFTSGYQAYSVAGNQTSYTIGGLQRARQYYFRIRANNGPFVFTIWVNATPFPITTLP